MSEEDWFYGEVVWFHADRGYGFLSWEKNGVKQKDMFTHYSDITMNGFKQLKAGQKVKFQLGTNKSGDPKAINIMVI